MLDSWWHSPERMLRGDWAKPSPDHLDFVACKYFIAGCRLEDLKYRRIEAPLFNGRPSPADVVQGGLGDCYFLASLGAVVQTEPEFVVRHLADAGNGRFLVTLYDGGRPVNLPVNNEFPAYVAGGLPIPAFATAPRAPGTHGPPGELWPLLYQKAYALNHASYVNIGVGGLPSQALRSITGREPESFFRISRLSIERLADWLDRKAAVVVSTAKLPDWRAVLGIGADPLFGPGGKLVAGHAYFVSAVDRHSGTIRLTNPWGYRHAELTLEEFHQGISIVDVLEAR